MSHALSSVSPADMEQEHEQVPAASPSVGWWEVIAAAVVTGLVATLVALVLWPQMPREGSVDVGFARDMGVHHRQAVQMSNTVLARTDDPEISHIAAEISSTQQAQLGQFHGWMDVWGVSANSGRPAMAWMGHPTDGRMPGMATGEQLQELSAADGREAEVRYLQLMTTHHLAGVEMAEAAAARAERPEVRSAAQQMVEVQGYELADFERILDLMGVSSTAVGEDDARGGHR